MVQKTIRKGDVYLLDRQGGSITTPRPVVVLSGEELVRDTGIAVVAPLARRERDSGAYHVNVYFGEKKPSTAILEHIRNAEEDRFRRKLGKLDAESMAAIEAALCKAFYL